MPGTAPFFCALISTKAAFSLDRFFQFATSGSFRQGRLDLDYRKAQLLRHTVLMIPPQD